MRPRALASAPPLCPTKHKARCCNSLPQCSTGGYQHGAGTANFVVLYKNGSSKDEFPHFLSDGPEVDQSFSASSVKLFCKRPNGSAQSGSPASPQALLLSCTCQEFCSWTLVSITGAILQVSMGSSTGMYRFRVVVSSSLFPFNIKSLNIADGSGRMGQKMTLYLLKQ